MDTEAGTYVKEFISSDFGRTNPSLGTASICSRVSQPLYLQRVSWASPTWTATSWT